MTFENDHTGQAKTSDSPDYLTLDELRARYAAADATYMTFAGIEVHYKDEGEGPAILMIHGSSSSMTTYGGVAAALSDRFRVIRYDVPGWGLSQVVSDAALAAGVRGEDFAEALLTHLGVPSATVTGVSSGGTTAYFLAAKRPDIVERLVLSNAPADPVSYTDLKVSKALMAEEAIAGRQDAPGYKRRSFWDAYFEYEAGVPDRITKEIRDYYYDNNRRVPHENRNLGFALVRDNARTRAAASAVTCPVLLLWGEQDPLLPVAAARVLGDYLYNAQLSVLVMPDVGHYPPLEVPDRYARIVAGYIADVTPIRPTLPWPADR